MKWLLLRCALTSATVIAMAGVLLPWNSGSVAAVTDLTTSTLSQNEQWVAQVYRDLLHREVDPASMTSTVVALSTSTRQSVAIGIIGSPEYRQVTCAGWYSLFLHRPMSSQEAASCVALFGGGGTPSNTDEQIKAILMGSDEYFTGRANSSNSIFIDEIMADLLHRVPDPSLYNTLLSCVNNAGCGRRGAAGVIMGSQEYRTGLCADMYQRYLHRPASPTEVNACVGALQSGQTDEQFVGTILGSPEYFDRLAGLTGFQVLEGVTTGVIASFVDHDKSGVKTDYSSLITWGDGHNSKGTADDAPAGNFYLSGANAYAEEGTYTVSANFTDTDNAAANLTTTAYVQDSPLSSTSSDLTGGAGVALSGVVAHFTDLNVPEIANTYNASINWGDGTPSTPADVNGVGPFSVSGSHSYSASGTYAVNVTITDAGGSSTQVTSLAFVSSPTSARIVRFRATAGRYGVLTSWHTVSRSALAGFRLERAGQHGFVSLGTGLLRTSRFLDRFGHAGNRYRLETIGADGRVLARVTVRAG